MGTCRHELNRYMLLGIIGIMKQKPRNNHLAFIFLQRGFQIPFPTNLRLFLDKPKWDYHIPDLLGITAYWIGEYDIGIKAEESVIAETKRQASAKEFKFLQEKNGTSLAFDGLMIPILVA